MDNEFFKQAIRFLIILILTLVAVFIIFYTQAG